jgi:hypothetical protein
MRTPTAPAQANSSFSNPITGYRRKVMDSKSLVINAAIFLELLSEEGMLVFALGFVNVAR